MATDRDRFYEPLIRPRSVAIVGASNDPSKAAGRPQRYLKAHGFRGRVYPVNPGRTTVQGVTAFKSIANLPETPDHAYLCVSTGSVLQAVKACVEMGVPVVSILADGFAEAGQEGEARQTQLAKIARASQTRVLGPNSMGAINCVTGTTLSVNAALDTDRLLPGRYFGISQSGSMVGTMVSRGAARGIGFAGLVSVGNEVDLTVGDIGIAAAEDPGVDAFLLFMETIRKPDAMASFAERAHALGKPIIVYKLGRSNAARELAVSHTGALVGSDSAADAFFAAHGITRVDQFETLIESPPLLIDCQQREIRRDKPVAVITTTGGGGAMVVDQLGRLGIDVAAGSEPLRARLRDQGVNLGPGRLTDVTLAGVRYETMLSVLDAFVSSAEFSIVVAVIGSSAQFHPQLAVQPIIDVDKTLTPVAGFMVPQADPALRSLQDAGIAGFRTADGCAEGVRAVLGTHPPQAVVKTPPASLPLGLSSGPQDEATSLNIMAGLGIEVVETTVVAPRKSVPANLLFPVAAKVLSANIQHKTDAGGVRLNIPDIASLEMAIAEIMCSASALHPEAHIEGVSVQPMVTGVAEVLVGLTRDPEVGPIVTLAMGGTLAEIYRDSAVRIAPVSEEAALSMIEDVKGLLVLRGYRNLPAGDVKALTDTIVSLSRLAEVPGAIVLEAEINPLVVRGEGEGAIAVDGLVVLGRSPN